LLDDYLTELTGLRDQLKAGLSGQNHASGDESGPDVAELADQVKALKTAHTIDASPQRPRQRHTATEEPVTVRIQRTNAIASSQRSDSGAVFDRKTTPEVPSSTVFASKPSMTFQERLAMDRRPNGNGQSPD
jgi:hypothetical protein